VGTTVKKGFVGRGCHPRKTPFLFKKKKKKKNQ